MPAPLAAVIAAALAPETVATAAAIASVVVLYYKENIQDNFVAGAQAAGEAIRNGIGNAVTPVVGGYVVDSVVMLKDSAEAGGVILSDISDGVSILAEAAPVIASSIQSEIAEGIDSIDDWITNVKNNIVETVEKDQAKVDSIANVCATCPCFRLVYISMSSSPESAQHILEAQAKGHPTLLTIDRGGQVARRRYNATKPFKTVPGKDRDEYPPALSLEGGVGASVKLINKRDNRSAGAQMRNQLVGAPNGCKFTMIVGP